MCTMTKESSAQQIDYVIRLFESREHLLACSVVESLRGVIATDIVDRVSLVGNWKRDLATGARDSIDRMMEDHWTQYHDETPTMSRFREQYLLRH